MRALCPNGFLVKQLVLVVRKPHELEALGAAADLRCHRVPRTLDEQSVEKAIQLRFRIARVLHVRDKVRLVISLAAALLEWLFEHLPVAHLHLEHTLVQDARLPQDRRYILREERT